MIIPHQSNNLVWAYRAKIINQVVVQVFLGILFCAQAVLLGNTSNAPLWAIAPEPDWVLPRELCIPDKLPSKEIREGIFLLLKDYQSKVDRTQPQENYYHMARLLVDATGVQNGSRIQISIDPLYESVTFHRLSILRDGKRLDRIADSEVREMVREPGMENNLLSGRTTLAVDVSDTRTGDILEYAFTVHGENPIYNGQYFSSWVVQGSDPISELSIRIIAHEDRALDFRGFGFELDPEIRLLGGGLKEWVWAWKDLQPVEMEGFTPRWVSEFPWMQFGDHQSWEAVSNWARPLYQLDQEISPEAEEMLKSWRGLETPEDQVLAALRWVQREIRYLAQTMGVHSHEPRSALEVSTKKYGDCKEKTVLLGVLLKRLGFECYPVLVSNNSGRGIENMLPSPDVFDHVILCVEMGEESQKVFMDATRDEHRGGLSDLGLGPFGLGLPIRDGQNALVPILPREDAKRFTKIHEVFEADGSGGARLTVSTIYKGDSADQIRHGISNRGLREIEKSYMDYYARFFPKISIGDNLRVEEKDGANELTVFESYVVPEIYQKNQQGEGIFEFPREEILSLMSLPSGEARTFPLASPHPVEFVQQTTFLAQGPFNLDPFSASVRNEAFDFSMDYGARGKRFDITRRFTSKRDHVKPEEYPRWRKDIMEAREASAFSLTDNAHHHSGSRTMLTVSVIAGFLSAAAILFLGWKQSADPSRTVRPPSLTHSHLQGIGGWLTLPAIGLPLGLVTTLVTTFTACKDFANLSDAGMLSVFGTWGAIGLLGSLSLNLGMAGLILLACILFFRKSQLTPSVVSSVFLATVVFSSLDLALINSLKTSSPSDVRTAMSALLGAVAKAAVWFPYFRYSKRVRATFRK